MKDPERREGQWLGLSLEEKIEMLKSEKRFDVAELYTIADVWGWTWERELRELEPEEWSQEKEVQLGIEIMFKVICLLHTHQAAYCRNDKKVSCSSLFRRQYMCIYHICLCDLS
jgi:hypothetical protein